MGDVVEVGDSICVVRQMKMELDVRAGRRGRVGWVIGYDDEDDEQDEEMDVGEGTLAAVLEEVRDEDQGETGKGREIKL